MFLFKGVIFRFNKLICQGVVGKKKYLIQFRVGGFNPFDRDMSQNGFIFPCFFMVKIGRLLYHFSLTLDLRVHQLSFFFRTKHPEKMRLTGAVWPEILAVDVAV